MVKLNYQNYTQHHTNFQVLSNRTDCSTKLCSQPAPLFSKAVILLVDALRHDFCLNITGPRSPGHSQNRLPVITRLTAPAPDTGTAPGKLYKFMADPPTTTMQRLKGLTTGSLPTFIDVSSNFGSYEISEDNIIDQLISRDKRVVFAGDDTWTNLFPSSFTKQYPMPSFDVWDLDTVDKEVTKVLRTHLKAPDSWDVFIGHFLGSIKFSRKQKYSISIFRCRSRWPQVRASSPRDGQEAE